MLILQFEIYQPYSLPMQHSIFGQQFQVCSTCWFSQVDYFQRIIGKASCIQIKKVSTSIISQELDQGAGTLVLPILVTLEPFQLILELEFVS